MEPNLSRESDESRDAFLERTRRQFLLARRQLAAHSLERYLALREMDMRAADAPSSPSS